MFGFIWRFLLALIYLRPFPMRFLSELFRDALRFVPFLALSLALSSHAADLPPELQEKQRLFKSAWDLIQQKQYQPALDLLSANLKAYPDSPTIDYEYVWSMYCMAHLGRYEELPDYYAKVSGKYLGNVYDPVTQLKRNWNSKLVEIACLLDTRQDPGARKALEALARIDQDRLRATRQLPGPRETRPFDFAWKGGYWPAHGVFPLVTMGFPGGKADIFVNLDQFMKSPAWIPGAGHIPLDARAAMKIGRDFIQSHGFPNAHVQSIELVRQQALEDRWYYIVTFQQKNSDTLVVSPNSVIVILLDGAVHSYLH